MKWKNEWEQQCLAAARIILLPIFCVCFFFFCPS